MKKLLAFTLLSCMLVCVRGFASSPAPAVNAEVYQHVTFARGYHIDENIQTVGKWNLKSSHVDKVIWLASNEFMVGMPIYDNAAPGFDYLEVKFNLLDSKNKLVGRADLAIHFSNEIGGKLIYNVRHSNGKHDTLHKIMQYYKNKAVTSKGVHMVDLNILNK